MTTRKRRESIRKAIVVLEGEKLSAENTATGIAPLLRASKYASNAEDEILVLTLLMVDASSSPSLSTGDHERNHACGQDPHIRFLQQEISKRKDDYRRIFRPFYERCKNNGVKFQVKIAAGFPPKDIIIAEANNVGATWILIDSSFARLLTFRLSGTECNVSLVSDVAHNNLIANKDEPESSMLMEVMDNPKSSKLMKGSTSLGESSNCQSRGNEQETTCELTNSNSRQLVQIDVPCSTISERVFVAGLIVEKPQQLSFEVIKKITKGFSTQAWIDQENSYCTYVGYLEQQSVLVKRQLGCSKSILEAEIRAALSIHHKNIMVITGYHQSKSGTILIFPLLGVTLDRFIWGPGSELKFQARLEIAIGIAQGIRYMHEECPQGPLVHGDLQPCNIFLGNNLQPMISGFGKATWLHYEQVLSNNKNRFFVMDPLIHESIVLVKNDVRSFGVVLLRLFCRASAPKDDKSLIEWARPLMMKRKFHELLEEDSDFSDMHGIYRVMAAATACTKSKPISRPYMTQVICLLKGQTFCSMQTSSSDSSM